MALSWSVLVLAGLMAFAEAKGVFYAFTGNGIDIIDPEGLQITKHISHNTTIHGTQNKMCTKNQRARTRCSWAGVTAVGDKYIYAADSSGNRVIVFDVQQQRPIKAIKTHRFPYQVTYLAALDEVWVLCWRNNVLDVVGDRSGNTAIQKINNASSLTIMHSIQAQTVKSYPYMSHSYLRAENCQNPDQALRYGLVSHYNEPGIHKIDLVNKGYDNFINTSSFGCKATFGLAYSSVKKYAFVQCLGGIVGNEKSKMVIVDVENDRVIHSGDAITNRATGYPYSSPDGKFIVVLNPDRVIVYYLGSTTKNITRFRDIKRANFSVSQIAFVKSDNGYLAYVTSKNTDTILVISLRNHQRPNRKLTTWMIKDIGFAADLSADGLRSAERRYKKSYKNLLKKTGKSFVEAEFKEYVKNMLMRHINRRISVGCGLGDSLVASPARIGSKMAIINGRNHRLIGMVSGVENVRSLLWIRQQ